MTIDIFHIYVVIILYIILDKVGQLSKKCLSFKYNCPMNNFLTIQQAANLLGYLPKPSDDGKRREFWFLKEPWKSKKIYTESNRQI